VGLQTLLTESKSDEGTATVHELSKSGWPRFQRQPRLLRAPGHGDRGFRLMATSISD
jgi:hypothetical protein